MTDDSTPRLTLDGGFKFRLDEMVYFLRQNKVACGRVLARRRVDKTIAYVNKESESSLTSLGDAHITYATSAGHTDENVTFASKAELLASL